MKTLVLLLLLFFTVAIPTVALPTVITLPATKITGYSATLNSSVNPNGFISQVHYRYSSGPGSCNGDFGTVVPMGTGPFVGGTSPVAVPFDVTSGFFPNTTYYFCAEGQSFEGTAYGNVVSFTTTSEPPAVSGTVTYGNAVGAPMPRFVSNVTLTSTVTGTTTTAGPGPNEGRYSLPGFSIGFCRITPSKTDGINGITSNDAGRVAQHVAGINILTGDQLTVADVSGDGTISSFDAAQIARFAAGLNTQIGSAGTWKFTPTYRFYNHIFGNWPYEDYTALLIGEVTGNWTNTGAR